MCGLPDARQLRQQSGAVKRDRPARHTAVARLGGHERLLAQMSRTISPMSHATRPITATRRAIQVAALAATLLSVFWLRGNAEVFCPMGGVESLYTYLREGNLTCSLAVSNFFLLGGTLLSVLLLRRGVCSYLCPVGTISEGLYALRKRLLPAHFAVPATWDRWLRSLKYAVLAAILYFTWSSGELLFRGYCPAYALISRHGTDITVWAYVVSAVLVLASLVVALPFCRWLCPLAAVMNPFSRFAVARVQRDAESCSACRACGKACPMAIPVDQLREVKAARCTSCLQCVEVCTQRRGQALRWGPPAMIARSWSQPVLVALLLLCMVGAVSAAYLFPLPSFIKTRGSEPPHIATLDLELEELTCRGRANLLVWFLERDDLGPPLKFFRLEAWPGPGLVGGPHPL